PDGEVDTIPRDGLPVRHVEVDRADRRAPAQADAVAGDRIEVAGRIAGIAVVAEGGARIGGGEPALVFAARDRGEAAPADRSAARHAEGLVGIAAGRLRAGRREQVLAGDAVARAGADDAELERTDRGVAFEGGAFRHRLEAGG